MLRNISHSPKLLTFDNHFILYVFLSNDYNIKNTKINIYTNKLIKFGYCNCDIRNLEEDNKQTKYLITQPEIYFPKKSFFATYKYKALINVAEENTLFIAGNNEFEKMKFEIFDSYYSKNRYSFTVQKENLLNF